ncbi:endonuclease [Brucella gallinifaecis]|uniref:Endonuclease n=1 Tax=Brucella gallinifaecis TaxID=215590 RepID=A0A502BS75_9HYPH|nr:endonuclease [Brucella gallinifaecis]TPF76028.1 endonuclease [Brucella gallinifaecis]
MPMLIVQLAILIAVAFVIGCILGRLLKGRKSADKIREDVVVAAALSSPAADEKPEPVALPKKIVVEEPQVKQAEPAVETAEEALSEEKKAEPAVFAEVPEEIAGEEVIAVVEADKPELLDAPLRGKPDDLTAINGIGKAIESELRKLGIFHYAQIAQWSLDEAGWIERHIGFAGRVTREDWIGQAGKLAEIVSSKTAKRSIKRTSKRPAKPKKAEVKTKTPVRSKKKQA